MSTYQAEITYADTTGGERYHTVGGIIANSVSGAFSLAMDSFFGSHGAYEIKKVVIEVQQSTWKATGDIVTKDTMGLSAGLKQLWNDNIRELNIYWLESNEEGDEYWWCDVMNDDLCDLCKTGWAWTVISRAEYEKDEEPGDSTSFADWLIIVDEEKFSDDLVGDQIKQWLRDRGFKFEVEVIDSEGTIGERRMLKMAKDANGE